MENERGRKATTAFRARRVHTEARAAQARRA